MVPSPGTFGSKLQPNFSQQILEFGFATELYHGGYAEYENAIKEKFTSRSSTPGTKTRTQSTKACKHCTSHHDAIYVADMERAKRKDLHFNQTFNGGVVCFDKISNKYINAAIHIKGKAKDRIPGSVAHTHTPSKRTPVATTKILFLQEETLFATGVPRKNYNSLHHQKYIGNASHRCFVLSSQNHRAVEILQLVHPWCDDQEVGRVIHTRNIETRSNAMAHPFDHFDVRNRNLEYVRKAQKKVAKLESKIGS